MKINVKGAIVSNEDKWIYDLFGLESTSPKDVERKLDNSRGDSIQVHINSGGGDVFAGSEIYTLLKDHDNDVEVKILGVAASAASVIAMAGDTVKMSPTSLMMIHNASAVARGDYREMDHKSNLLKNVNHTMASAYKLKSGKEYEELLSMMDDETWISPEMAKEHNLIDEIMFSDETPKLVASAVADHQLIPPAVMEKVRNAKSEGADSDALKAFLNNADEQASVTQNKEGEVPHMDLEKLKSDYPELYEEVKAEGKAEGAKEENQRIKNIEELAVPGNDSLVNKAKFEDVTMTAPQLAVEMIRAQKEKGQQYMRNAQSDAKELEGVKGSAAPENNSSDDAKSEEAAASMASFVNKKRGGK